MKYLVNGSTITQCTVNTVTYYHIELPKHDVALAEGLTVETFLDTGNRGALIDGNVIDLYPDFSSIPLDSMLIWDAKGYAALVVTGSVLDGVRQRLILRGRSLEEAVDRRAKAMGGHKHQRANKRNLVGGTKN